jgi:hypothetical protein
MFIRNALLPVEGAAQGDGAFSEMPWAKPEHSRERVNAAGKAFARDFHADAANWSDQDWERYLS